MFLISMVFSQGSYTKVNAEGSNGDVESVKLTSDAITIENGSEYLVSATILPKTLLIKR